MSYGWANKDDIKIMQDAVIQRISYYEKGELVERALFSSIEMAQKAGRSIELSEKAILVEVVDVCDYDDGISGPFSICKRKVLKVIE